MAPVGPSTVPPSSTDTTSPITGQPAPEPAPQEQPGKSGDEQSATPTQSVDSTTSEQATEEEQAPTDQPASAQTTTPAVEPAMPAIDDANTPESARGKNWAKNQRGKKTKKTKKAYKAAEEAEAAEATARDAARVWQKRRDDRCQLPLHE